jgi:tRNA threonylcarbamoyladenosine biosynthesis protein TsaB
LASLFVDTTYDITLGLLDASPNWLALNKFEGQKVSSVLQKETFRLCQEHQSTPDQLQVLYTVAGPGFYTGLRLAEGLADVFSFFGIAHYSFYSYEIPLMCGYQTGVWVTKAYRGEYFFHHWKNDQSRNVLIAASDLPGYDLTEENVFIHSDTALDDALRSRLMSPISTHDLLRQHPQTIFSQVLGHKTKQESFYFRAPEDEFRVSL